MLDEIDVAYYRYAASVFTVILLNIIKCFIVVVVVVFMHNKTIGLYTKLFIT